MVRSAVIALLGTQVLFDAPLWALALNMIASSALRGCFEPVAYALVADVVTPDQRVAAFGFQRMATNLGWAVGPAVGSLLTLVVSYGAVFYLAAGAMIAAALVTLRVEDPIQTKRPAEPSELAQALRDAAREPLLRLLLLGTFLCALLETQMFSTFAIYMTDELGCAKTEVGLLYTINGVCVLVLQMPALIVLERFGLARVLPWSSLFDAIGFALIGAASGFAGGAVAIVTLTCAEVLFDPAHQAAIAECSDPERRGRTFGVAAFAQMVGVALAPLVGGTLLDTIGDHHAAMWLTISTIGLLQTLCFIAFVRRRAIERRG